MSAAPSLAAVLLAIVGGYLLGAIPFGVIVTRLGGAGDVRSIGSGSIGATNVLRTGRRDLALLTVLGDGGKGAVAVLVARALAGWATPDGVALGCLASGAAFVGHIFPVWLGFKGGKGVATFFGILLAAAWPVGAAAALTWLAVAFALRISSLAGLSAAALAPVCALALRQPRPVLWLTLLTLVLIYIRHAANIRRLLRGEEPRIGAKNKAGASPPSSSAGAR